MQGELRVIATAGHVDHGKSSLIDRLTGIDPDRFAEEKRRGLTIDLGYAWCTLPSGREVGFVDVPGHERFVRNMLAGVGPVRLVLFVVAADEGWKPQSEEHLQILDVLDVAGGVIALTKIDLVDDDGIELAREEVAERVRGTRLEGAPVVPVSSHSGLGVEDLVRALDDMLAAAPAPDAGRTRLFVDRAFSIKGAGTVVTGTLSGDCLTVGDEVEVFPSGRRARVRSLETHKKAEERTCPISRVAVNLVGAEREELERGDVLGTPGAWRPTAEFDAELRPVRGLDRAVTARGAFKLYAGAAELDARIRFLEATKLEPRGFAFARIRLHRPVAMEPGDRFVIREAGRRATVAGGIVLDVRPPRKVGNAGERLAARRAASRDQLPELLVAERGAVRVDEAFILTGSRAHGAALEIGEWLIDPSVRGAASSALERALDAYHHAHPLAEGMPIGEARSVLMHVVGSEDRELIDALLDELPVASTAGSVRARDHSVALDARNEDLDRLLAAIEGGTPPTVAELIDAGHERELIDAAARSGSVVKIGSELVFDATFVHRAEGWVRGHPEGFTVSAFREALNTSRKYAVPLLEHLDHAGVTRRDGDLRFPRG